MKNFLILISTLAAMPSFASLKPAPVKETLFNEIQTETRTKIDPISSLNYVITITGTFENVSELKDSKNLNDFILENKVVDIYHDQVFKYTVSDVHTYRPTQESFQAIWDQTFATMKESAILNLEASYDRYARPILNYNHFMYDKIGDWAYTKVPGHTLISAANEYEGQTRADMTGRILILANEKTREFLLILVARDDD